MGYLHIQNLYKDPSFLEKAGPSVYAMEKVHGTSANITFRKENGTWDIKFHSGGESHVNFVKLFDADQLMRKIESLAAKHGFDRVIVYGEAYGGKCQKMSATYGPSLKFVAFDVFINDKTWLTVPEAAEFCKELGIEFVHYETVENNVEALNAQRDADSTQAIRNGMGPGHMREGVVVRPFVEVWNAETGERLLVKHKRVEFQETATPREVDPSKIQVLKDAEAIANEWVVEQRLEHVLDKLIAAGMPLEMSQTKRVKDAMLEDIKREGAGEIVWSPEAEKEIGKRTTMLFKSKVMSVK